MINKSIIPQVMCATCGHVFSSGADVSEINEVTCPECGTTAKPKGIMQPSGFPSLDTFKRNWEKSKSIIDTEDTIENQ